MNHSYRATVCFSFLMILFIGLSSVFAQEDPRLWDTDGIAIRQGTHLEWQRASAMHDDGSVCTIWSDTRNGNRDIYAQRTDPDGISVWQDGGIRVVGQADRQENPVIITVEDGWIIAWVEYVDLEMSYQGYNSSVYAQKLDLNGTTLWRADGALITNAGTEFIEENSLRIVPDLEGGALIAWSQHWNIFVQRINSTGVVEWNESVPLADHAAYSWHLRRFCAVPDGEGNMIAVWVDQRDANNQNIYGAKIMADGSLPWGEGMNGVPICLAEDRQNNLAVSPDYETGGVYCAWEDARLSSDEDVYIQRIDGRGGALWDIDGVPLCDSPYDQNRVQIAASMNDDIQDGVVCVWEDRRVGGYINEVYAQKVSPEGILLWGEDDVLVCGDAAPGNEGNTRDTPRILSDRAGGAIIYWNDTRHANSNMMQYDLYAARLDASGGNLWSECGELVADGNSAQHAALMILNEETSLIEVIYADELSGSKNIEHTRLSFIDGGVLPETENVFLVGLDHSATYPKAISMSGDRVGIVWEDRRGGYSGSGRALYYQIVDAGGAFELPMHGSMIAPDNLGFERYYQDDHELASDGNGGFFVSFIDLRADAKQVRLSRIDQNGGIACDLAGVLVSEHVLDQMDAFVCPDGSGGCYIAWSEFDFSFTLDVYVMHFDENCMQTWADPVRLTDDDTTDDVLQGLVMSSNGCCILTWETGLTEHLDIHAASVCSDGTINWSYPICDAERRQAHSCVVKDGNGGIFMSWSDRRTEDQYSIYVQHLSSIGQPWWEQNGIPVRTDSYSLDEPKLAYSIDHGLYVVWQDFRSGQHYDLYAQRIDEAGTLLWDEEGLAIATEAGDQVNQRLLLNNLGGFTCVWSDYRSFYRDIYGTDILPDGSASHDWWVEGSGGRISTAYQSQQNPALVAMRDHQAFVTWVDWRATGFSGEGRGFNVYGIPQNLYMQLIETGTASGADDNPLPTPLEFALNQNYPNPFNPTTTISFSIPKAGHASLVVYDLLGRSVETLMDKQLTAGSYHVPWDASALPSGVYFYRLTAGEFSNVKKTVLLK